MDAPILRLDPHSLPKPHRLPAGAMRSPRVALEITRGRVQQRIRPIVGKVFLIGAASDCDLVLGDLQFPEAYAYVFVAGSRVSIRRLDAGPELSVCGETVTSAELFHGDVMTFGPFELRVLIDAGPRGGRDDEFPQADDHDGFGDTADADQAAAVEEVRLLLVDIRRCLSEETPVLHLYHESESSAAEYPLFQRVSA
jgi:hypothetical protein